MKNRVFDMFIWSITVVFLIGIFFLPEQVPLHWNINWEIDRYGSRYELLIMIFIPLIFYYGLLLTKKIDPKLKIIKKREKTYELIRKLISIFFVLIVCFFYILAIRPIENGTFIVCFLIGSFYTLVGNYMPKFPQNYFLGIRNPWTLSNERVWTQTHKKGGYLFVIGGLLIILGGLLSPEKSFIVIAVVVISDVLLTMAYSYIEYKRLTKQ